MEKNKRKTINTLAPVLAILFVLLVWFAVSEKEIVPTYMLPTPVSVAKALFENFSAMTKQALVTIEEAVYGLLIGAVLGFFAASLMDRFEFLNAAVYPLLVISQTIPTIAIAPILVLWMGFGVAPKITLVVITSFFPITVGLLDGFKSVDPQAIDLMRSMKASRLQIFYHVKLPVGLPGLLSGLKISTSYAMVSAVVSEWLGGTKGLGVYMMRVKKAYAFDKLFAVIIYISAISLLMIGLVSIIEKVASPWNRKNNSGGNK